VIAEESEEESPKMETSPGAPRKTENAGRGGGMICVLPVCEAFADNPPGQYKALFLKFPCSPLCKIYLFSTMICLSSRRNTLTHHKASLLHLLCHSSPAASLLSLGHVFGFWTQARARQRRRAQPCTALSRSTPSQPRPCMCLCPCVYVCVHHDRSACARSLW